MSQRMVSNPISSVPTRSRLDPAEQKRRHLSTVDIFRDLGELQIAEIDRTMRMATVGGWSSSPKRRPRPSFSSRGEGPGLSHLA